MIDQVSMHEPPTWTLEPRHIYTGEHQRGLIA